MLVFELVDQVHRFHVDVALHEDRDEAVELVVPDRVFQRETDELVALKEVPQLAREVLARGAADELLERDRLREDALQRDRPLLGPGRDHEREFLPVLAQRSQQRVGLVRRLAGHRMVGGVVAVLQDRARKLQHELVQFVPQRQLLLVELGALPILWKL